MSTPDTVAPETLVRLRARLVSDESVVLHGYVDSLGYLTLGVGRCIDERKGGGISHAEAMYLLDGDINTRLSDVIGRWPQFLRLDPVRQIVLMSMAFQLGVDGLASFTDTLSAVWRGDYRDAAAYMLRSRWATRESPARAYRLSQMMHSGSCGL